MLLIIMNIIYFLIVLLIYKSRVSKKDDIRVFNNDYDFYEKLPKETSNYYWKKSTQYVIAYMVGMGVWINAGILFMRSTEDWMFQIILLIGGFALMSIIYFYLDKKLRDHVLEGMNYDE